MANVEIYTKETCPYCHRAKALLSSNGREFPGAADRLATPPSVRDDQTQRSHHGSPEFLLTHSTLAAVMTCMHWMHVVDWIPC